ncbi:TIR domain-containing protein [Telluribacter sp. SYSU D00476]|uniref:TIR domain-containing protein n=1 Tax=Telluribacter sp. SYSU D00476 TaxID=2811430 RepID=UPI001FF46326|nr:TIR domain-containing protein [Telluribacter sp. SYSU D00476]
MKNRLLKRIITQISGYDAFISYRHAESREYAEELYSQLTNRGLTAFLDESDEDSGTSIEKFKRIACKARSFVLVASPEVYKSKNVYDEVQAYFSERIDKWYRRPFSRIISINVDQALSKIPSMPEEWKRLNDYVYEPETIEALVNAAPSKSVVEEVAKSSGFMRTWTLFLIILGLITICIGGGIGWASIKLNDLFIEIAKAQEQIQIIRNDSSAQALKLFEIDTTLKAREASLLTAQNKLDTLNVSLETKQKQLTKSQELYNITWNEAQALNIGQLALNEIDRDPTLSFRLAEISLKKKVNPIAISVLIRNYNSNNALYSHLYKDIRCADIHPNGNLFLVVYSSSEQNVELVNLNKGKNIVLNHGDENVVGVRFVRDSILTWTNKGRVHLWNFSGNELTRNIRVIPSIESDDTLYDKRLSNMVFMKGLEDPKISSDGRYAIYPGNRRKKSGRVDLWDLIDGKRTTFNLNKDLYPTYRYILDISSNKTFITICYQCNQYNVWDFYGNLKYSIPVESGYDYPNAKFLKSGKWLVVSNGRGVEVWQGPTLLKRLKSHKSNVNLINISHNGRYLITTSSDGTSHLYIIDEDSNIINYIKDIIIGEEIDDVAFSYDNTWISFSIVNGTVEVRDLEGDNLYRMLGHSSNQYVNGSKYLAWTKDNKAILSVSSHDQTARLWQLASKPIRKFLNNDSDSVKYTGRIAFNLKGNKVGLGAKFGNRYGVEVFDINGTKLRHLNGHKSHIETIEFNDDSTMLTHSTDCIKLWKLNLVILDVKAEEGSAFLGKAFFDKYFKRIILLNDDSTKIRAWSMKGEKLIPPSQETLKQLGHDRSYSVKKKFYNSFDIAEWQVSTRGTGYFVRSSSSPISIWLDSEIKRSIFHSSTPNNQGYIVVFGSSGWEFFLLDEKKIIEFRNRTEVSRPIWQIDNNTLNKYGILR